MNVSSLLKHIDQLRLFCETHKPHVLCLNETKPGNEIRDEDLVIEGFHAIYRKDRDRHGGGVAMFISEEFKFFKREDLETDFESLTVELDIQYVKPILIPQHTDHPIQFGTQIRKYLQFEWHFNSGP